LELAQERLNEAQQQQVKQRQRIHASGLPKGLQGLEWGEMRTEMERAEVIEAVQEWIYRGGGFFLHSARPGPGKTRLAATACWHMLTHGFETPTFVQSSVLFTKANADFSSDGRREAERILLGSGPLFLDDLGKESNSQLTRQLLQACLDERLENEQHIFITSNMTAPQLGAHHGDWLASRLARFRHFRLPGPDMRLPV
ncbi:MAG TPA: ATP-binding protein, partial [Solirubrobacterales bacterium]